MFYSCKLYAVSDKIKISYQIKLMSNTPVQIATKCYHCGEICSDSHIRIDDKIFCCNGCKTVYQILDENNLCNYYDLEGSPGSTVLNPFNSESFAYLDDESVVEKLLDFSDAGMAAVTFFIPSIHCSSCIWLLEKVYELNPAITSSRVNFIKKEVRITFNKEKISLRQVVELLTSIGYEPKISLQSLEGYKNKKHNRSLYYKIGIAGFAFGNSMLFNFPEYLDIGHALTPHFKVIFGGLNILLSLPVLFYSASGYFKSAYQGLHNHSLNIDVPIVLGILVLLTRSIYEITSGMGPGYLDSFNGLIFFLLIGRLFQDKTYQSLSFDRDFKSYFPVSVTKIIAGAKRVVPISKLKIGDRLIVRNQELIPADALLLSESAQIDYSFVTGESRLVKKYKNEIVYAGGRLNDAAIEIQTIKHVAQSYLTKLWNSDTFEKQGTHHLSDLSDKVAGYFTFIIITIAAAAGIYWYRQSWQIAVNVVSAVLIVACPCALALSIPFTFGHAMRIFGKNKFYLKNIEAIETIHDITHIVFDKTGTLTWQNNPEVIFSRELDENEKIAIKSLVQNSIHPLSRFIYAHLENIPAKVVKDFVEIPGQGISGNVDGCKVCLGSPEWCGISPLRTKDEENSSAVYLSINEREAGAVKIKSRYRPGLKDVLAQLAKKYKLSLISGDNDAEKGYLSQLFGELGIKGRMLFNQSPHDKRDFILRLQNAGEKVLMIGDGLNDAGALKQSDFGTSISEDINVFSPACDAILDANSFRRLPRFLNYAQDSYRIVLISFGISFLYNIVGMAFAVSGYLSPLVSAILMPISSISVVAFATVNTYILARKMHL